MGGSFVTTMYLILALVSITSHCIRCEQLSTVFVLETSDSSADSLHGSGESAVSGRKAQEDSNTKIITDDSASPPQPTTNSKLKQQQNDSPVVINNHSNTATHNNGGQDANTSDTLVRESKQRDIASARRIEEEAQLAAQSRQRTNTATRSTNQSSYNPPQATAAPVARPRTSTSSSYDRDNQEHLTTTPKTEERLLISITSEDDEYRPPQKHISSTGGHIQPGSGSGHINDESSVLNVGPSQQNQKRKPSITISIQDANINKQNGGSGASSVIVRPSENGQSIVISTVNGDHKYIQNGGGGGGGAGGPINKPSIAIVTSPSVGQNNHQINNNNNNNHQINEPYREPPYHHTTSTTYRPSLVNDYNPNANRPITSTLIDQPRPPISVNDDRPHRPSSDDLSGYESSSSSSSRPTARPTSALRPPVNDQSSYGQDSSGGESTDVSRPISGDSITKYPLNEKNCGLVHETRIVGGEEADPDDFLWMAAIIKSRPGNGEARPFCGGSLITRRHILTAAHCLENLAPRDVLVRLGSYDFDDSTASSSSADFAIDQFRVPAQYSKKTHAADIAIMRLKTPLSTNDNYKTVCMPQPRRSYVGALGTVTGYGSQSQTFRRAAPKLRQVTVPIWENRKCSVVYKKNLTESFLCAGYEEGGKDACQGDSGGPLMTEGPNERMMIVGVVSHGIGCGSPGYPGVYTRTTTYLDWIEKNTKE